MENCCILLKYGGRLLTHHRSRQELQQAGLVSTLEIIRVLSTWTSSNWISVTDFQLLDHSIWCQHRNMAIATICNCILSQYSAIQYTSNRCMWHTSNRYTYWFRSLKITCLYLSSIWISNWLASQYFYMVVI